MATLRTEDYLYIERFSVYFWRDYQFLDGSPDRDKYIITLNCKASEFPLSIILPTSKETGSYYSQSKNLEDCVIIDIGESEYFEYKHDRTIVDLKHIYKEDQEFMVAAHNANELSFKGILEKDLQERITKAIDNSVTLDGYEIDKLLCR